MSDNLFQKILVGGVFLSIIYGTKKVYQNSLIKKKSSRKFRENIDLKNIPEILRYYDKILLELNLYEKALPKEFTEEFLEQISSEIRYSNKKNDIDSLTRVIFWNFFEFK